MVAKVARILFRYLLYSLYLLGIHDFALLVPNIHSQYRLSKQPEHGQNYDHTYGDSHENPNFA